MMHVLEGTDPLLCSLELAYESLASGRAIEDSVDRHPNRIERRPSSRALSILCFGSVLSLHLMREQVFVESAPMAVGERPSVGPIGCIPCPPC